MSNTRPRDSTIPPAEVAERRDDESLFILDVRNEDSYEEWRIEGSYNLPVYDQLLEKDVSGLAASLDEIPNEEEIVVVCVAGITSAHAAQFLREQGYDARSMENGMGGWGRVHVPYEIDGVDGVTQIVRPGTGCISYLVADGVEGVLVDPSLYVEAYRDVADERGVEIVAAIDTHAHADHISGGRAIAEEFDVPYYLNPTDAANLEAYAAIEDGDGLAIGTREMAVLHTPGHTPGSVSLTWDGALLSGDTLFLNSVGRPDLEGDDEIDVRDGAKELFESLRRFESLSGETIVLPGHFADEEARPLAATLAELRGRNELFGMDDRETFVETIVESLSEEPANYNRIKAINWGKEPLTEDAPDLELGPNNCAAN